MRVLPSVAALLLSGCYLFSDEPKARKHTGDELPTDEVVAPTPTPTPVATLPGCPSVLTGTEVGDRTIAGECGVVSVRGQYRIEGGSLTLAAGVELRVEPGAVIDVGRAKPGTLRIEGTAERPVKLSGGGQAWLGVRLHGQATGSQLQHVVIEDAGESQRAALWIAAEDVTIEALTITGAPALSLELAAERGIEVRGAKLAGAQVVARATPQTAGGLHALELEPGASVAIAAGQISSEAHWSVPVIRVEGFVRIEGSEQAPASLTIEAGTRVGFDPAARLIVGGFQPGKLIARGRADAAIVLAANDPAVGWPGVHVQTRGEATLEYVELEHAGSNDEAAILGEGEATLAIDHCTLRASEVGVELRGNELSLTSFEGNAFVATPAALRVTPQVLGRLGEGNVYDEQARIHVERGKIEQSLRWRRQGAPLIVHGEVSVDRGATLTLDPGLRLEFDADVVLQVGYYEQATLELRGSVEAPIELGPSDPSGTWRGIEVAGHATRNRFEHVRLRATSGAAGIDLREAADATLVDVACAKCAHATVTWDCASKVGNLDVVAGEGTPLALLPPECPG
ncbi:hypothetical protein ACNOYE_11300 [Nannocystaceae bacterium ST9]